MRTRLVILLESKNHHLVTVLHIVLLNTLSLIICLHIAFLHLIKYMQTSYPLCLFLISYMKLLTTQSQKLSWLKKRMHYKYIGTSWATRRKENSWLQVWKMPWWHGLWTLYQFLVHLCANKRFGNYIQFT